MSKLLQSEDLGFNWAWLSENSVILHSFEVTRTLFSSELNCYIIPSNKYKGASCVCLCVPMCGQRAERELRGWLTEIRTLRPKRHEKGRGVAVYSQWTRVQLLLQSVDTEVWGICSW